MLSKMTGVLFPFLFMGALASGTASPSVTDSSSIAAVVPSPLVLSMPTLSVTLMARLTVTSLVGQPSSPAVVSPAASATSSSGAASSSKRNQSTTSAATAPAAKGRLPTMPLSQKRSLKLRSA